MYLTFFAGLISILTPVTFLITFFLLIAFSHFDSTGRVKIKSILSFCAIVVVLYSVIGISLISISPIDLTNLSSNVLLKFFVFVFNLAFGLWISGIIKYYLSDNETSLKQSSLMIIIFAIVFTLTSFSATAPIIGALMFDGVGSQSHFRGFLSLFLFSFGLIIPVGLILIFMERVIKKVREKTWWKNTQLISGIVFLILSIIGLILK